MQGLFLVTGLEHGKIGETLVRWTYEYCISRLLLQQAMSHTERDTTARCELSLPARPSPNTSDATCATNHIPAQWGFTWYPPLFSSNTWCDVNHFLYV